jgi:hypothetical protein
MLAARRRISLGYDSQASLSPVYRKLFLLQTVLCNFLFRHRDGGFKLLTVILNRAPSFRQSCLWSSFSRPNLNFSGDNTSSKRRQKWTIIDRNMGLSS